MTALLDAPVAECYRRLRDAGEAFRIRVCVVSRHDDSDPDLVAVDALVHSPAQVDDLVTQTARRLEREHGVRPAPHVAATRALHDYAWPAALLLSAPWFLGGAVPMLRPEDLRVRPSTGTLEVVPTERLRPEDPDTALLAGVAGHHRPLVEALGEHLRRGPRAAWGLVTDDLLSGIWYAARMFGVEAAGVRAATRLLPSATGPFPGGACFRQLLSADGALHTTRTRLTCCLHYRLAGQACVTCPRTCDAERAVRLAADTWPRTGEPAVIGAVWGPRRAPRRRRGPARRGRRRRRAAAR